MAEVKLTKNELRSQQVRLAQLEKYLPTLKLKKAMLQAEIQEARARVDAATKKWIAKEKEVEAFSPLLTTKISINPKDATKITKVRKRSENIAGVELPYFEGVDFEPFHYNLFETPPWVDVAIESLRRLTAFQIEKEIVEAQREALEKEWREVSIRVNLFEKILIPRSQENIRAIKVFLNDQELAAVSRAKVAKGKIHSKLEEELNYA